MSRFNFESVEKQTRDGKIFFTPEMRMDVFEASKKLAELIQGEGFENIVFIDASARPMSTGLSSYWKKAFIDEKRPNIFFLNPSGFHSKTTERVPVSGIAKLLATLEGKDIDEDEEEVEIEDRTNYISRSERLNKVHPNLLSKNDLPTLVVDTCIHSGETASLITRALKEEDFSNVKLAAVSETPSSEVKADYYLMDHPTAVPCFPFGPEGIVEKSGDVVSKRTTDPSARKVSKKLREEIRDIIDTEFEINEEKTHS